MKTIKTVEVEVTQQIIDSALVEDPYNCIGAMALRSVQHEFGITNQHTIKWGRSAGAVQVGFDEYKWFNSDDEDGQAVNMMAIKEPQKVFIKQVSYRD